MTPALEATPLTRSVVVGGEQALSFFIFLCEGSAPRVCVIAR